jgi:hypothetical protein
MVISLIWKIFTFLFEEKKVTNRQFCSIVNFNIGGNRLLLKSFRQSRIFFGYVGVGRIASLTNGFGAMLTSFLLAGFAGEGVGVSIRILLFG